MPRFSGRSSIGTWLYRIAYNACIDQLRRRGTPMATAEEARDVRSAADTEHAALTRLTLAEALAALPVDQRAAVLLVDVDGFSYAEAGGILG
jgi:RNA polymerase sigma-70 factor (ECF subfamily)